MSEAMRGVDIWFDEEAEVRLGTSGDHCKISSITTSWNSVMEYDIVCFMERKDGL